MFENWRERKWRNKGTNKQQPDFGIHHTSAHCPLPTYVPNFNLLGLTVCDESVTKNFNVWKLERKKNEVIKGQIRVAAWFLHTIHLPTVHICTKFHSSRPHSSWEKCDEKFQCMKTGEKEKWRNKEMNKQQQPDSGIQMQPDSGIHDTSAHCPRVYQVSIF